jgi:hypothetical protein
MQTDTADLSKEYLDALEANNVAINIYTKERSKYYARQIGDTEFLAARDAYNAAMATFDIAFNAERDR